MRGADRRSCRTCARRRRAARRARARWRRRAARSARPRRSRAAARRARARARPARAGRPRARRRAARRAPRGRRRRAPRRPGRRLAGAMPRSESASSAFSRAPRKGTSPAVWPTKAIARRRSSARPARSSVAERDAVDEHVALVRDLEPGEQVQQRRLAGARRPRDDGQPARERTSRRAARTASPTRTASSARAPRSLVLNQHKLAPNGLVEPERSGRAEIVLIQTRSSSPARRRARRRRRRAVAWRSIPAERRSSSGSRSQPPRPTTIAPSAPPATRSSLMRPSRTWTTRSARSAEAGSWLTTSAVPPSSRDSSAIRSSTSRAVAASSSPVGSSAISSCGRRASAAQSATRCCSPPESSRGCASRRAPRPTRSSSSSARASRRASGHAGEPELHADELARGQLAGERAPVVLVGVADRARAEAARRPRAERARRRCRPRCTEPAEGWSKPATIRSRVDLPEPLGPSTTQSSPRCTVSVRPCSAATPPSGGRVDAEEVAQLDERAHSRASARPGAGAENARRVARRTSAAAARTYTAAAPSDDEHVDVEHERRLGRGRARGQPDEVGDDAPRARRR